MQSESHVARVPRVRMRARALSLCTMPSAALGPERHSHTKLEALMRASSRRHVLTTGISAGGQVPGSMGSSCATTDSPATVRATRVAKAVRARAWRVHHASARRAHEPRVTSFHLHMSEMAGFMELRDEAWGLSREAEGEMRASNRSAVRPSNSSFENCSSLLASGTQKAPQWYWMPRPVPDRTQCWSYAWSCSAPLPTLRPWWRF